MTITNELIGGFCNYLIEGERSAATVARYVSVVNGLMVWLGDRELCKGVLIAWRDSLTSSAATINVAVSAVNRFTAFLGRPELKLMQLRTQQKAFRDVERELTRDEYECLVDTAERLGKERLARMTETICSLGIRVSELRFITVEALDRKMVTVRNKGKERTVLLNASLTKKLAAYCRRHGIKTGPIFITRTGRPLNRTQIWAEMKALCAAAGVEASKVFPHNLRHLFAVTHYRRHRNLVKLAGLLGHRSVNTTRIYLLESGEEQLKEMDLGLVRPGAPGEAA